MLGTVESEEGKSTTQNGKAVKTREKRKERRFRAVPKKHKMAAESRTHNHQYIHVAPPLRAIRRLIQ